MKIVDQIQDCPEGSDSMFWRQDEEARVKREFEATIQREFERLRKNKIPIKAKVSVDGGEVLAFSDWAGLVNHLEGIKGYNKDRKGQSAGPAEFEEI